MRGKHYLAYFSWSQDFRSMILIFCLSPYSCRLHEWFFRPAMSCARSFWPCWFPSNPISTYIMFLNVFLQSLKFSWSYETLKISWSALNMVRTPIDWLKAMFFCRFAWTYALNPPPQVAVTGTQLKALLALLVIDRGWHEHDNTIFLFLFQLWFFCTFVSIWFAGKSSWLEFIPSQLLQRLFTICLHKMWIALPKM